MPACRRLLFPLLHACNKGNRRRLHAGKGGSGLVLFLDQTEAPKSRKMFLGTAPPPLSRGLDDRSPPPTPHLKVWIGHLYWVICENERNEVGTEWVYKLPKPRRVFGLLTSDFRLPTSVAIKGGGRPTRLLPYAKMLLVSITFFSFCWVDCAIEGSTFFTEQMRF